MHKANIYKSIKYKINIKLTSRVLLIANIKSKKASKPAAWPGELS